MTARTGEYMLARLCEQCRVLLCHTPHCGVTVLGPWNEQESSDTVRFANVLYHRCLLTGQQGVGAVSSACGELGVEATAEKSPECSLTVDLHKRANVMTMTSSQLTNHRSFCFCVKHSGLFGRACPFVTEKASQGSTGTRTNIEDAVEFLMGSVSLTLQVPWSTS